jgi:hypothetical protein
LLGVAAYHEFLYACVRCVHTLGWEFSRLLMREHSVQNAWPERPRSKAVQGCYTGLRIARSMKTLSLLPHGFLIK